MNSGRRWLGRSRAILAESEAGSANAADIERFFAADVGFIAPSPRVRGIGFGETLITSLSGRPPRIGLVRMEVDDAAPGANRRGTPRSAASHRRARP